MTILHLIVVHICNIVHKNISLITPKLKAWWLFLQFYAMKAIVTTPPKSFKMANLGQISDFWVSMDAS